MDIILLRFLLLLLFSLQIVKEDVSIENKIQLFILLGYIKGVGFFGNPKSFRAGFNLLSRLGEYLSRVKLFPDSIHILLEVSEQLINNLYQMLVKVGYLFKYLSWAISKDFCCIPQSEVYFLSPRNCFLWSWLPWSERIFFLSTSVLIFHLLTLFSCFT